MNISTLRRHPSLQPLSRDHGIGLVCAQRLHKAVRAGSTDRLRLSAQIRLVFENLIATYLDDEQRILSPVIANPALLEEFQERHRAVRRLTAELYSLEGAQDPGLGLLSRIADVLDDYVRWEEHTLFPLLEENLDDEQLNELSVITSVLEAHRTRPTQELHASIALNKESGLAETCGCKVAKSA